MITTLWKDITHRSSETLHTCHMIPQFPILLLSLSLSLDKPLKHLYFAKRPTEIDLLRSPGTDLDVQKPGILYPTSGIAQGVGV